MNFDPHALESVWGSNSARVTAGSALLL